MMFRTLWRILFLQNIVLCCFRCCSPKAWERTKKTTLVALRNMSPPDVMSLQVATTPPASPLVLYDALVKLGAFDGSKRETPRELLHNLVLELQVHLANELAEANALLATARACVDRAQFAPEPHLGRAGTAFVKALSVSSKLLGALRAALGPSRLVARCSSSKI